MRRMITDKLTKNIKEVVKAYEDGEIALTEDIVEVVANPTLAGDEAELTGLQVGDTKYAMPQGGGGSATLYRHSVLIELMDDSFNSVGDIIVDIISSDNTAITSLDTIKTIIANGTGNPNKQIIAQGVWKVNSAWKNIVALRVPTDNILKGLYFDTAQAYTPMAVVELTGASVYDTVYTL